MYPTTIASLGAEIEGDRLGLGTNLFSDKKTLIERTSLDYVESEFSKSSDFYNDKILMDDYNSKSDVFGKEVTKNDNE